MGSNLYKKNSVEKAEVELSYYNLSTFFSDYIKFHGLRTAVKDLSVRLHVSILDLEMEEKENEPKTEL